MKLIYCPSCGEVRSLDTRITTCLCGDSFGWYKDDGLNAVIGGKAIPLGFANDSFLKALLHRPEEGMGERFEAFVIPKKCVSVHDSKEGA